MKMRTKKRKARQESRCTGGGGGGHIVRGAMLYRGFTFKLLGGGEGGGKHKKGGGCRGKKMKESGQGNERNEEMKKNHRLTAIHSNRHKGGGQKTNR